MSVYLSYGVAELNNQYNPRKWSSDHELSTLRSNKKSQDIRDKYKILDDLSYGDSKDERLDILLGNDTDLDQPQPVFVFFHGGGWQRGTKKTACYPADLILDNGGIFIAVNFSKIDRVSMKEIVRQSQAAVAWVYHNIANFGGDPEHLYICGKSSGAHQAGMVLMTDWANYQAPTNTVKGALLISGAYDLEPLSLTARRASHGINEGVVEDLSPMRQISALSGDQACDVILAYAQNDSDEIKRQTEEFAAQWRGAGFHCAVIEEMGVDHFSIGEPMGNPNSALGRATLALLKLKSPS